MAGYCCCHSGVYVYIYIYIYSTLPLFLWYMEQNLQNLQLPVNVWKITPTCYHRNKGKVEHTHVLLYLLCRVLEMRFCPMLMLAMPSFMS